MVVSNFHELINNLVRRCGSIDEEQVVVLDTLVSKMLLLVFLFVKSNDSLYAELLENRSVFVWVMSVSLIFISLLYWTHESHKLSWYNPIEIAVFDSFIVLILFDIEVLKVVPLKLDSVLKTLKTL